MQTFIVTCFTKQTNEQNLPLSLVITPPLQVSNESVTLTVPHNWLDHPFVTAQFEIERRWNVGACHGSRPVFDRHENSVLIGEIDFDSV